VDPAEQALAAERLRRLKGRTATAETAPLADPAAKVAPLALAANPFAVLEVDLTASVEAIGEAYDSLSFEPDRDPAALDAARAALHSPRERLEAEMGWLPGLPAPTLVAARKALRTRDLPTLAAIREKAAGIARLNLALALVDAAPQDAETATQVLWDAQQVDSEVLLETLDDLRFAASFREIERDMFDTCLRAFAQAIGARIAPAFAVTVASRALLAQVLQQAPASQDRFVIALRDELLRAYGAAIDPALEQARTRIMASAEALGEQPDNQIHATSLLTSLDLWSSLRRPVQVHEAARGLDDPASAEIFESIRTLTVRLSNDHNEFDIALRLGRALIRSFALVPMHRAALQRELPTLLANALVKRAGQIKQLALRDGRGFARQVEAGGLDTMMGVAGLVAALFADADEMEAGDGLAAVFLVIRDISVELHNKYGEKRAAYLLIQWLARQSPPPDIASRFEADLRHFGVRTVVAARESRQEEAPVEREGEEAPRGFGRARRSDGEVPPPPAPPPLSEEEQRERERERERHRERERDLERAMHMPVRRRARVQWGFTWKFLLFLMVFNAFFWSRGPRREPAVPASRFETPAADRPLPRYTPRSAEDMFRDAARRIDDDVERRRQARRYRPGQPMSDARPVTQLGEDGEEP